MKSWTSETSKKVKHFKMHLQVLLSVKKLGIGQKVGNKGDRGSIISLSLVFLLCD